MSDLTDQQWNAIRHLFEDADARKTSGRPGVNVREVINAIRWVQCSGERWLHLPASYPPQQTCYQKYLIWKKDRRLLEVARLLADTTSNEAFDDNGVDHRNDPAGLRGPSQADRN